MIRSVLRFFQNTSRSSASLLRNSNGGSSTTTTATTVRFYRGDAGEMQHNLSESEEALLKLAKPRYDEIYERHVRLPKLEDIPKSSMAPSSAAESSSDDDLELEVRKKRLIYRAKQRGWLEVDLLLGTWANTFVPTLNSEELDQFEAFVNTETIDIYNIITLRVDIPDDMKQEDGNSVVERIQEWARDSPLGKADPEAYKRVKTDNNLI